MTRDAIARLLKPRSVAVIGASADPAKTAGRPVHFLLKHGFTGQIMPVNPKVDTIAGLPCFRNIAALPIVPSGLVGAPVVSSQCGGAHGLAGATLGRPGVRAARDRRLGGGVRHSAAGGRDP